MSGASRGYFPRTYMLYSAATLAASLLGLVVQSTAPGAGRVLLAVLGPLAVSANLAGLAWLVYHVWVASSHQHRHLLGQQDALRRVPWTLLTVFDHYVGLNLAWALLLLVFWAWDPAPDRSTFIAFAGPLSRSNVWAAWLSTIGTSFQIFNGVGFSQTVVVHPASEAVTNAMTALAGLLQWAVIGVVIAEGYELAKQRTRAARQSGPDADADAGRPLQLAL